MILKCTGELTDFSLCSKNIWNALSSCGALKPVGKLHALIYCALMGRCVRDSDVSCFILDCVTSRTELWLLISINSKWNYNGDAGCISVNYLSLFSCFTVIGSALSQWWNQWCPWLGVYLLITSLSHLYPSTQSPFLLCTTIVIKEIII